jgi:RNA polymerase sigma-70 factor (ECF subfamily)
VTSVDPFVIQQAEIRASRMVSSNGFKRDDWEDLRQDLLLDYLERLPQFDPDRGDLRGFMFGVVRHRAAQLAAQHRRRAQWVADNGRASQSHTEANYDLRLDVEAAVSRLPEHLQGLARLLSERTPREAARVTGKSRSRIYQLIQEIRTAFMKAGVTSDMLRHCGGAV